MRSANNVVNTLGEKLYSSTSINDVTKIDFHVRMINEILPYSMLIIDSSIVYVSFYKLSTSSSGTEAPTVRLIDDRSNDDWADTFISEAIAINSVAIDYVELPDA